MTDTMVICGLSALDYWRKAAGAEFDASYERLWEGMRVARPCDTVYSRAADLLVSLGLPAPLHLLADSPGNRRTSLFAVFHTYREPPLDHDLIELSPHVIVCSPMLAIAQVASTVSPAELDLLYLEFCGTYLLSPASPTGFVGVKPYLTKESLFEAFQDGSGYPACKKNKRLSVLERAAPNSNSPAESACHAMLSLPRAYGGLGVPGIELNKTLLLGPESAAILGTDRIRPDFYIEDAATAGEYKSKAFHSSDDWANDSRRLDALESMGLHTFTLDAVRANNLRDLTGLAHTLCDRMGLRYPKPRKSEIEKRVSLHKSLFYG